MFGLHCWGWKWSSDEAFWAAGRVVPPPLHHPPARPRRPPLQGDQAQVWPAEDGREWVQLTSPPNLFIWHFHRQGQRRRSAQAPLASPGGWEPTSPSSRERGWEIFMKSFHFCQTKLWMRLERDIPQYRKPLQPVLQLQCDSWRAGISKPDEPQ